MAVVFALSLIVLIDVEASPDEGEPVEVIDVMGQQWTWGFRYSTPLEVTTTSALSEDPADVTLEVSDPAPFEAMATQINPELKDVPCGGGAFAGGGGFRQYGDGGAGCQCDGGAAAHGWPERRLIGRF